MAEEMKIAEPCGVLIVNKHAGITSHDVVNRVRRLYGTRRVGHTGTLDPMATGVLVVLVGRAAKAAEYLVCDSKRYRAVMRLGMTTDSEDITGEILTKTDKMPQAVEVLKAAAKFEGEILQVPPMYSALKVGGRKLVDIARQGGKVERKARPVTVYSLACLPTDDPKDYMLEVHCSSGTYIRTLCADIGAKLGVGAVMAALERVETGGFSIDKAYTLDELSTMSTDELAGALMPVEALFKTLPAVAFPSFYEKLFRSGCEIYQKKIGGEFSIGQRVRVLDASGRFFALGEVREYPDGSAIKSIKFFEL